MDFLTKDEIEQLLHQWHVDLPRRLGLPWRREIHTPEYARRQTALVNNMLLLLPKDARTLVHVTGWSTSPSIENMALFAFLRSAWGESRPLIEVPGHLLGSAEQEALECLFDVALYFDWDAAILDENKRFLITLSNDGFIEVACTLDLKPKIDRLLDEFEVDT